MFERKHTSSAFTGEGARRYGGRWNSPGVPVIYVATSFALALLEVMANARSGRIPPGYAYCPVDVPEELSVERVPDEALPTTWYASPAPREFQAIGDAWFQRGASVALFVPSAIARIEHNALLNPAHADFKRLTFGELQDLPIDARPGPSSAG